MKRLLRRLQMGRSLHTFILMSACILLALGQMAPVSAQERSLNAETSEKVDAVLLLDTSGSMLLNDPQRLRDEGARLFIQFLKPGDNLGIIDFSETAQVVRPLTPYDASQQEDVAKAIAQLRTEGQYTDLLAAIQQAQEMIESQGRAEAKPVIVLLSDGKMDPNPVRGSAVQRTQTLLEQVLPELRTRSRRVYTLAFSPDADKDLLQQIAAATDAIQWYSPSANEVHQSFADLFLAVKRPQVIPLGAKGFTVDENVSEATFYINRATEKEVQIQHPNGQVYTSENHPSNIKWYTSQRFEVITIIMPDVGTWRVSGVTKDEGFATILTNLRLITDWGTTVEAGRPELLQARLYESEKPVALPEMTGLIRYAYQVTPTDRVAEPIIRDMLDDSGESGDKIGNDGIFAHTVQIDDPGEYELRIIAKAPTFERQLQIPFRVKPPFVTLTAHVGEVGTQAAGHDAAHGDDTHADSGHGASGHGKTDSHADSGHPAGHGSAKGHGDAGHEAESPGGGGTEGGEALQEHDGLVTGNEGTVFVIELNDEARALKNLDVQLSATDDQRRLVKLPVEVIGTKVGEYSASAALLPADGRYELRVTVSGEGKGRTSVRETSRPLVFKRVSTGDHADGVVVVVQEEKTEPEEEEGFSFLGLILMVVIIAGAGGAAIVMAKRAQGDTKVESTTAPVGEALMAKVKEVEERQAVTEVDLNAPEFEESASAA